MSFWDDTMKLDIKQKANLEYTFYQGKTSEGKLRTVAKCTISCWCFPEELWEYFFKKYNKDNYNADFRMEISAQCTCSDKDIVNEELGKRIARKKLLSKYFAILEDLTEQAVSEETKRLQELSDYLTQVRKVELRTISKLSRMSCGE